MTEYQSPEGDRHQLKAAVQQSLAALKTLLILTDTVYTDAASKEAIDDSLKWLRYVEMCIADLGEEDEPLDPSDPQKMGPQ